MHFDKNKQSQQRNYYLSQKCFDSKVIGTSARVRNKILHTFNQ